MKKLLLAVGCVVLLASCGNRAKNEALKAQNDSLSVALAEKDAEMEGILGALNEVQEGFRLINEAENRVDLQRDNVEGASDAQKIKEDIRFISEKLQANREQIKKLEDQLNNSRYASAQMKKTLAGLKAELESREQQIATLQETIKGLEAQIVELQGQIAELQKYKLEQDEEKASGCNLTACRRGQFRLRRRGVEDMP